MKTEIFYRFSKNLVITLLFDILLLFLFIQIVIFGNLSGDTILVLFLLGLSIVVLSMFLYHHIRFIRQERASLIIESEQIIVHRMTKTITIPFVLIKNTRITFIQSNSQPSIQISYVGERGNLAKILLVNNYKSSIDDILALIEDRLAQLDMEREYGVEGAREIYKEIDETTGNYLVILIITIYLILFGVATTVALAKALSTFALFLFIVLYNGNALGIGAIGYLYYQKRITSRKAKKLSILLVMSGILTIVSFIIYIFIIN